MTLDFALTLSNTVFVLFLLVALLWKHIFRALPVFVVYQAYTLLAGCLYVIVGFWFPSFLIEFWTVACVLDTLLCLWVLIELVRSLHCFNHRALPPLAIFFPLLAVTSAIIWPLTQWSFTESREFVWRLAFRVMQGSAILEASAVLTVVLWSNLKKLHWPERELRIITGIGCWAIVQLGAVILHSDGLTGHEYHWVDLLTPFTFLGVAIYWLHYFWLEPRVQSTRTGAYRPDQALRSHSRQDQKVLHKYALESRQAQGSS